MTAFPLRHRNGLVLPHKHHKARFLSTPHSAALQCLRVKGPVVFLGSSQQAGFWSNMRPIYGRCRRSQQHPWGQSSQHAVPGRAVNTRSRQSSQHGWQPAQSTGVAGGAANMRGRWDNQHAQSTPPCRPHGSAKQCHGNGTAMTN